MNKNRFLARCALAAAAAFAGSAQAQTAGTWLFSLGATCIAPNTSSGNLSPPSAPGTTIDVGPDTEATLSVGRMITDHWSWELPIGFGYKHKVFGSGAIAGVGQIGTVKALPITLFAQYRFLEPTARTVAVNERWYVDLQYAHSFLKTTATLSTGQKIDTRLDPDAYRIAVGFRF